MVESWEQHNALFVRPHRVKINPYDPERHVWIIPYIADVHVGRVQKYTPKPGANPALLVGREIGWDAD